MRVNDQDISGFDIIGDVHGCLRALQTLLTKMDYALVDGVWSHPNRKAVFVGDLMDRGPQIRDTMDLVRNMVEANQAYMVLGNHEYNAVVYSVLSQSNVSARLQRYYRRLGTHLRESLVDYRYHLAQWHSLIHWLREIPIFLEFENFRVVHACWDPRWIEKAETLSQGRVLLHDDFLADSLHPKTDANRIVERLLKGTDLALPDGHSITGSDGIRRDRFRTKFWCQKPLTYADVIFQPDRLPDSLMQRPLSSQDKARLLAYPEASKALFFGHYWCQGSPSVIRNNLACLDYSAVKNGLLVAYRMGKEDKLSNDNFVWVPSTYSC